MTPSLKEKVWKSMSVIFVAKSHYSGDYQFDVYRMMRQAHSDDNWEKYRPITNVMVRLVSSTLCHCSNMDA